MAVGIFVLVSTICVYFGVIFGIEMGWKKRTFRELNAVGNARPREVFPSIAIAVVVSLIYTFSAMTFFINMGML